jgi:hypothetical protein
LPDQQGSDSLFQRVLDNELRMSKVFHDAAPIETAMQADGDESRLARHEASSLGYDR